MSETVPHPHEIHDQAAMHREHWRQQVEAWQADHAAMLDDLRAHQEAVARHLAQLEGHLAQVFDEHTSPTTHDYLEQTPEGRELAGWLQRAHQDYVEMVGLRSELDARVDAIHEAAMSKLARVVKVFEAP